MDGPESVDEVAEELVGQGLEEHGVEEAVLLGEGRAGVGQALHLDDDLVDAPVLAPVPGGDESVEFGGGLVAAAVDRFSVAAIGTIGTAILLIFLGMLIAFLVWDKSVRLLPENWEMKLNFTRKLIRRLKALLLIPDDENVAPETEMRLQLKPPL